MVNLYCKQGHRDLTRGIRHYNAFARLTLSLDQPLAGGDVKV